LSKSSSDRLVLGFGRSRALAAAFGAIHLGALALALLLPVPIWLRAGLAAAVIYSGVAVLRRHVLRSSRRAVTALVVDAGVDDCELRVAGEWVAGRISDSWVQPWLTILVVRRDGRRGRTAVLIPADGVASHAFRQLRVRLRLRSAAG
jgi:hypothetical protein